MGHTADSASRGAVGVANVRGNVGAVEVVGEVVKVSGEIDMSNVAQLKAAMERVARRCPKGFVVDLTEIGYLDGAALRVFGAFARGEGAPSYLLAAGSTWERAFQIVGLRDAIVAGGQRALRDDRRSSRREDECI